MTALPSWLPNPSRNYAAEVDPHLATTDFEIGQRQRRRFAKAEERISVVWEFSQFEYDTFCYFVSNIIESGALPFDISILGFEGMETRNVQLVGGRFSSRPLGIGFYTVSASLVCQTAETMDSETFGFLFSPECSDPDLFIALSLGLYDYIEHHYGDTFTF